MGNHMFRTVLIIFGLIMFAILAPIYRTWGIPGAIVMGAIVPGLFGILLGTQRSGSCRNAKDCFKADEQLGCGGVFVAAIAAMVAGSFVAHHNKDDGFPVVVLTFLLGVGMLFAATYATTYLRWAATRPRKDAGQAKHG